MLHCRAITTHGALTMPSFRPGEANMFLNLEMFEPCMMAEVTEGLYDLDGTFNNLRAQYPGIPAKLLEVWFTNTCLNTQAIPVGTELRVQASPERATVTAVNKDGVYVLWDDVNPMRFVNS